MNWLGLVYQKLKKLYRVFKRREIKFHVEYFYERNLHDFVPSVSLSVQIEIKMLAIDKVAELHQVWPVNLKIAQKRLMNKHSICYLSYVGGELAGYHWVQFSGKHFVQQAGTVIEIKEGEECMIYHTRVAEKFQGKGINKYILATILQDFRIRGVRRALIYTSSQNIPNQKGLVGLGFKHYFSLPSLQVGKKFIPLKWNLKIN